MPSSPSRRLSFLGLGFPADFPTWGRLLFDAKDYMNINAWRVIWPGVLISVTVMCVNFIGDGLRDALDPQASEQGLIGSHRSPRYA